MREHSMLRLSFAGLAAFALASASPAQSPNIEGFSPAAFRSHVAFLADDLLEGREAGTRGYDIAARYVAAQFEALGLVPAADGNWYQDVQLTQYRHAEPPLLALRGRDFQHGRDFIMRPHPRAGAFTLEAPLVFVGRGLDAPTLGFDDYAGLDVHGKIVVALGGYPEGTRSDIGAHLTAERGRMAAARGAVGMIMLRTTDEAERTPWERAARFSDRPGTGWSGPDGEPFDRSGLGFTATAGPALAEALFEGAPRSLPELLTEDRPAGFPLAGEARIVRQGESTGFSSPNVVAVLPGSDPALAGEFVLLMAHLDGLGIAAGGEGDTIRNGAMDNATGIATLIEVARRMTQAGAQPRRPILFAAVTAEEKGLLGAEYLAKNPVVDGRIVGVVNLDMPILTYDFQDVIAFGAEHSTLGETVARAAERMGIAVSPDPLPEEGLFTRSDHYRFVAEGVPSVFLMTGFAGEGEERFRGFLANEYHSPRDDLALPFRWDVGAKFARLNYLIAREIADADAAPRWYADSFFGATVGAEGALADRP
jgi:hypothetical protein